MVFLPLSKTFDLEFSSGAVMWDLLLVFIVYFDENIVILKNLSEISRPTKKLNSISLLKSKLFWSV